MVPAFPLAVGELTPDRIVNFAGAMGEFGEALGVVAVGEKICPISAALP